MRGWLCMTQKQKLDDIGGAWDLAIYRLDISKEMLDDAEANFDQGRYRTANNRAYYAIFQAISACLALEQKSFKSHGQVIGNFNKDFVHTGIFPKELGKRIKKAQELREASDYEGFYIVSIPETKQQLETARVVVDLVKKYFHTRNEAKKQSPES